jgi:putative FmdB family regulatory protein
MPTYEYECEACGHRFDEFQSFSAEPLTKCPECGKKRLRRLFGGGAAIIFKGSGFYETDYRSSSYKEGAKADAEAAKPAGGDAKSSESAKPSDGGGSANGDSKSAGKGKSSKGGGGKK